MPHQDLTPNQALYSGSLVLLMLLYHYDRAARLVRWFYFWVFWWSNGLVVDSVVVVYLCGCKWVRSKAKESRLHHTMIQRNSGDQLFLVPIIGPCPSNFWSQWLVLVPVLFKIWSQYQAHSCGLVVEIFIFQMHRNTSYTVTIRPI